MKGLLDFSESFMTYFLVNEHFPAEFCGELSRFGAVLPVPCFPALDFPVSAHPDMLAARVGGTLFVHAENMALCALLSEHGIHFRTVSAKAGKAYPADVALNLFTVGKLLFACEKHASAEVLAFARENGYEVVNVRQGYAKCSTMILDNAIVTADAGIYKAAKAHGVAALLISPAHVGIEKYDTGFIGGASGTLCAGKVCVFGSLNSHPDGEKIRAFALAHGVEVADLGAGSLFDYGGLVRVESI